MIGCIYVLCVFDELNIPWTWIIYTLIGVCPNVEYSRILSFSTVCHYSIGPEWVVIAGSDYEVSVVVASRIWTIADGEIILSLCYRDACDQISISHVTYQT